MSTDRSKEPPTLSELLPDDPEGLSVEVASPDPRLDELPTAIEPPSDPSLPPHSADQLPDLPVSLSPLQQGPSYEDRGLLGSGGMGEVRYVVDRRLRRPMALKTLAPHTVKDRQAVLRFIEEAQITGQLDHPNIVPIHTLGVDEEGGLYFTM